MTLPVVFEFLEAIEHAVEPEVHRAHVERRNFGLEGVHRHQAFGHQHGGRATGGYVDDDIGRGLDVRQEGFEQLGVLRRRAIFRLACVQVNDGGARFSRANGGGGNLLPADGQIRRH